MQVVEYLKAAMKSLWPGKSTDAVVNEIVGSRKLKVGRILVTVMVTFMVVITHYHHDNNFSLLYYIRKKYA